MTFALHFAQHISALQTRYEEALEQHSAFSAILLHSGREHYYFADDQSAPFRANPHFTQWLAVNKPDQVVLIVPGQQAHYLQVTPADYWYEQDITLPDWVREQFVLHSFTSSDKLIEQIKRGNFTAIDQIAFIGEDLEFAKALGVPKHGINPTMLVHHLDFQRAVKTQFEIASIRKANRQALQGHAAARHAFIDGASEFDIHMAYLHACEILEHETPYTNIVALDEKAAILHYQNKRREPSPNSQVLLIDAGCRVNGYCSDITRTSTKEGTLSLFCDLVEAVEALQSSLIRRVKSGIDYPDIHRAAHEGLSNILLGSGICRGSVQELKDNKVSTLFMPHGIGHLLGIQVHDVGGRMKNPAGEICPPPEDYPSLRTTRKIEVGQVFTIEPGLYFIPLLLNKERNTKRGRLINWDIVDMLMPLGGIRIEDNVLVTETGFENLTRVLI